MSPRRRELLASLGVSFEVDPPRADETPRPDETPSDLTQRLALEKAQEVAQRHRSALILAADTVVSLQGAILGKPSDSTHARSMLRQLSGQTHLVFTGFALLDAKKKQFHIESVETRVTFHPLSDEVIERYLETEESLDKAGAYGIQGFAGQFVKTIQGSYSNVVGLPLEALRIALPKFGIQPRL
ncbi:MAG: hypothetical protein UW70_C0010G0011 [Candidatus Peregrinibacteria bacterium GW2011_GWA2_44_7]|nr:MAG: hypothetical protein UW70_C0010G0011 [Candidatus Peregrinibacteria bacterium GW2011_GWA2_44_7]